MNLLTDLANVLRSQIKAQGYDVSHVQGDDHAALMLYSKVLRYTIEPRPRGIRRAASFQCPTQYVAGLQRLEQATQAGKSLTPYRSRGIERITSFDGVLDYWGIHHFHLGTNLEESGFVERTDGLLFCLFDDDYAYFLKLGTHDSSQWTEKELVEIIHQNWPELLEPYRIKGITRLAHELSDDDRKKLRNANISTFLDMKDGTIYIEPGLGNTTGGLHIQDLRWADHICRVAEVVESHIATDWPEIVEDARTQGYHLRDTTPLVLVETVLELYWDVRDPESGYWFRRYVQP